jgi:acyl carrier protein
MIEQLIPIFKEVFNDDDLKITQSTTAKDIDGWDSLAHIRLIVAIEKFFKLRFTAAEISELENVGEMIDLILKKKANV